MLMFLRLVRTTFVGRPMSLMPAAAPAMSAVTEEMHAYKHDPDQKPKPVLRDPFHDIASLSVVKRK
jgi:hypothetical protein